jgi:nucleotide-binding universal stress UspA family protein
LEEEVRVKSKKSYPLQNLDKGVSQMIKNMVVAIDGSEHAKKSVEFACRMATAEDAKIYLIHVVQETKVPEDFVHFIREEGVTESPEFAFMKAVGDKIIRQAEDQAKTMGFKDFESVLLHGDPSEQILKFSRNNNIDTIIMGSRGLGNLQGILMGSVSKKVCHLAECTCVTVK